MHDIIMWGLGLVEQWGYYAVVFLMALESSIFPVPSEIVVPPAAIIATQGGGMTFWGVVLTGTLGSWLGAAITYWVSRIYGRPFIMKYGKYFFMPPHKVERAEIFLQRYERGGIFFARLLPVVRHLISIPAGMMNMSFAWFSLMTVTGSLLWCTILAWFGDKIGRENPDMLKNADTLVSTVKHESSGIIIAVAILCFLYIVMMKMSSKKNGVQKASLSENKTTPSETAPKE